MPPRPHTLRRALLTLAPFLLLAARAGAGQEHALLQPLDPIHDDLDRLAAWGVLDSLVVGQRPYSRGRAAAMVAQAIRNAGRVEGQPGLSRTVASILERSRARLGPELDRLEGRPRPGRAPSIRGARLDGTWTDSPSRPVPSNDVVRTAAVTNPLLAYDQGRPTVEGTTAALELEAGHDAWDRMAFVVRPRIQAAFAATGARAGRTVALREAYGRLRLGNAAVTLGRAPVTWGQGLSGGLLLSHNPAPLTMVGVSTETPFAMPGILRFLGPSRHQLFVAELGEEGRSHPHALLIGLRSSFLVDDRVEVGFGLLNQQGGEGAPGATLLERVADVLIVPDLLRSRGDYEFSQKMALADLRLRLPHLRELEVWLEAVLDDFDLGRIGSMLWEDGGWLLGARLSRLDEAGHLSLALEGQHTGVRFYGHLDYAGGVTLDRRVLGSELGMAGTGVYGRLGWDPGGLWRAVLDGAWERRSNDRYRLVESPPDLVRTAVLPKEDRWRTIVGVERSASDGSWSLGVQAGLEGTQRFAFTPGDDRHSALFRIVAAARAH